MTEGFINEPEDYKWSEREIYLEFLRSGVDKKSVRRQFCITLADLNRIIKNEKA